jgi:hypothetical protein
LTVDDARSKEAAAKAAQKKFEVKGLGAVRKHVDEIGTSDNGNAANGQSKNRVEWAPRAAANDLDRQSASRMRKIFDIRENTSHRNNIGPRASAILVVKNKTKNQINRTLEKWCR